MDCTDIHPLLAGYVDGELTTVERQAVEDHVAGCADCGRLLAEQRAGAQVYAAYPVEEAGDDDWQTVWAAVEARLPAKAKRVTLESLSDLDVSEEFLDEDAAPAGDGVQPAEAIEPQATTPETAPPAKPEPEPDARADVPPEEPRTKPAPVRLPGRPSGRPRVFKPIRMPRWRHTFWAHVTGIAAAALIVAAVLISVKPTLRVDQFATSDQVDIAIEIDPTGTAPQPVIMYLQADGQPSIPMIWVAHVSDGETDGKEESVQ